MDSPEMLATSRERRSTAGNRLGELLDKEDSFYMSAYGGFEDDENDSEYSAKFEEQTDSADSDFSVSEADASGTDKEEHEEEDAKKQKGRRKTASKRKAKVEQASKKLAKAKTSGIKAKVTDDSIITTIERKSVRKSTSLKSALTIQHLKDLEAKKQQRSQSKKIIKRYEMTQEELLEEAKKTEIINLKSLERYEKCELEKRERAKAAKKKQDVPMIRYHTVGMPCIDDSLSHEKAGSKLGMQERTFISFPDQQTMEIYFPKRKAVLPPKPKLTVNGELAKYFDPVTKIAYNTVEEYRQIRSAYHIYDGSEVPNDEEIADFQNWYSQIHSIFEHSDDDFVYSSEGYS